MYYAKQIVDTAKADIQKNITPEQAKAIVEKELGKNDDSKRSDN